VWCLVVPKVKKKKKNQSTNWFKEGRNAGLCSLFSQHKESHKDGDGSFADRIPRILQRLRTNQVFDGGRLDLNCIFFLFFFFTWQEFKPDKSSKARD
jgi:hypothetical protein